MRNQPAPIAAGVSADSAALAMVRGLAALLVCSSKCAGFPFVVRHAPAGSGFPSKERTNETAIVVRFSDRRRDRVP